MPHLAHAAIGEQHLHDVEAHPHGRLVEQAQVVERALGEATALVGVHRRCRARPVFRGARFDFDEDKAVAVAENQVNFPAGGTKIRRKKLQSEPAQMAAGSAFAELAAAQMFRLGRAAQPATQSGQQLHVLVGLGARR